MNGILISAVIIAGVMGIGLLIRYLVRRNIERDVNKRL